MRVTITCEECGERHRLERRVSEPGPIWIVCHNCELPLQAVLDGVTIPDNGSCSPALTDSVRVGGRRRLPRAPERRRSSREPRRRQLEEGDGRNRSAVVLMAGPELR